MNASSARGAVETNDGNENEWKKRVEESQMMSGTGRDYIRRIFAVVRPALTVCPYHSYPSGR
jgi:hypothetical protein